MSGSESTPSVAHLGARAVIIYLLAAALAALAPATNATAAAHAVRIVALGDSLTAGFQLPPSDAFPAKLEAALRTKGSTVEIANAGVSGDTTAAALERLDWAVPDGTDGVILELGANDMLRGVDPAVARSNLKTIIDRLQARHIPVLLAGMKSLSNWGPDYARSFNEIYPGLAAEEKLTLYPFFMDGVIGQSSLSLQDGLHPNAAGVDVIVARILPVVEAWLGRLQQSRLN